MLGAEQVSQPVDLGLVVNDLKAVLLLEVRSRSGDLLLHEHHVFVLRVLQGKRAHLAQHVHLRVAGLLFLRPLLQQVRVVPPHDINVHFQLFALGFPGQQ